MKQEPRTTVEQAITQIRIMVGAMLAGVLIFTGLAVFLILGRDFSSAPNLVPLFGAVLATIGVTFLVATSLVSRLLAAKASALTADSAATDEQRLKIYMGSKILRVALSEAFGLIGTVFMLVTGSLYFLAAPVLAAWLLTRLFPRGDELKTFAHSIGPGASTHGGAIQP